MHPERILCTTFLILLAFICLYCEILYDSVRYDLCARANSAFVYPRLKTYDTYLVISKSDFSFEEGSIERIHYMLQNQSGDLLNGGSFSAFQCGTGSKRGPTIDGTVVIFEPIENRSLQEFRGSVGSLHKNYPGVNAILAHYLDFEPVTEIYFYKDVEIRPYSRRTERFFSVMHEKRLKQPMHEPFERSRQDLTDQCCISFKQIPHGFVPKKERDDHRESVCLIGNLMSKMKKDGAGYEVGMVFVDTMVSVTQTVIPEEMNTFEWKIFAGISEDDPLIPQYEEMPLVITLLTDLFNQTVAVEFVNLPVTYDSANLVLNYNILALRAYDDRCDYIFQIEFGTVFVSKGWTTLMIKRLKGGAKAVSPRNGPFQVMVDRSHIDRFDFMWPWELTHSGVEEWMPLVYGKDKVEVVEDFVIDAQEGRMAFSEHINCSCDDSRLSNWIFY